MTLTIRAIGIADYISKIGRELNRTLVRRTESKKCANTGTGLVGNCCIFQGRPWLTHGLNGIVIARIVRIGKNVTILQHVTIAGKRPNLGPSLIWLR